jgi:hypothetical protein
MNGSVDPSGIGSSGLYNNTFNLTRVMVDVGGNFIWIIFLLVFVVMFFGIVYMTLKR